ncbi:MAG: sulfotransferase [Pseudomonadales bacterium]|nr:sulfotransferase [Pseudomonadales bacterium]
MPVDTELKETLSRAMKRQLEGNFAEAEKIYREILKKDAQQPDALHLLGLIRMEQENDEEAVKLMEQALGLFPSASHFHHNIAGLYRRTGRLEEAEARFREAIRLKPDYGEAYQGLAEMVKFQTDDPLIKQVDEQLRTGKLEDANRSYFHFAAGKILDDIGKHSEAFRHYVAGNRLANRNFETNAFRESIKNLLYYCSRSFAERNAGSGIDSEAPVFVVGMPRSGTTLVEQILSSHSEVFGAGELNEMKFVAAKTQQLSKFDQAYPASLPGLRKDDYANLADAYLRRLQQLSGDGGFGRYIDKHPLNFQFVGLIYAMFPNARIIHTVRNPLDTCLSCYFQNFTKGQDYSFDLTALAHFYNDYRRVMEHWETIYPGKIYTVCYEDLVENQEEETRRLLEFMGLEFEQNCIDFHKTDRKVSTASFLQVRKPIYKSSKKRWVNYRQELSEVARIIGVSIEPPVTITGSSTIQGGSILS